MDNKFDGSDLNLGADPFGTLPDGQRVSKYMLSNSNGMSVSVIDYGATITELKIPTDRNGVDVVLGFDRIEDYVESVRLPAPPHFGAAIGRFAGRISNGRFSIGGETVQLDANNGPNTLHGGKKGFDKVIWQVIAYSLNSITLYYKSPDGDQHFPGELDVAVEYSLTDDNELRIVYDAVSSKDTVINLTQHSYFNLDGQDGNVLEQDLMINAGSILEIDDANIPSGNRIKAADKGFDFREFRKVPAKIDDSFLIEDTSVPAAQLRSEKTGISLTVYSDQPSLHIYVGGNLFGQFKGKGGVAYQPHSGICFESQNYTDAPNHPNFPSAVLRKGDRYTQKTIWKFEWQQSKRK
ncbi:MAG TPA: aldose epimerase family protein [Flavobacterium sp.]|jgi:aldose 1-epimerase